MIYDIPQEILYKNFKKSWYEDTFYKWLKDMKMCGTEMCLLWKRLTGLPSSCLMSSDVVEI